MCGEGVAALSMSELTSFFFLMINFILSCFCLYGQIFVSNGESCLPLPIMRRNSLTCGFVLIIPTTWKTGSVDQFLKNSLSV